MVQPMGLQRVRHDWATELTDALLRLVHNPDVVRVLSSS